eukprot:2064425-Amphidinium_carterae.1
MSFSSETRYAEVFSKTLSLYIRYDSYPASSLLPILGFLSNGVLSGCAIGACDIAKSPNQVAPLSIPQAINHDRRG